MTRKHEQKGAFRSGEGTPDQIYQRLKLFEEEEELDRLEEEGISSHDLKKEDKLFERQVKRRGETYGLSANDKLDLKEKTRV